jgi:hypothetical protein
MIKAHEANSAWWGSPVALITDPAWFAQNESSRARQLEPYAWAEFRAPLDAAPRAIDLQSAGFAWIDSQIKFRISLTNVPYSPSLAQYECVSAKESPFILGLGEAQHFVHERFLQLPGVTADMLSMRYIKWANELIIKNPEWCMRLFLNGQTQGWFLSEASGSSVALTLAMLASNAAASGQHLYQRALREYANRGGTVGHASFSLRNTSVMNIYANLGARFTAPTAIWLWCRAA